MPNYTFNLNGSQVTVDAPADLALLWVLRDKLGLTGPKYGCGLDVCKACTCLIDGKGVLRFARSIASRGEGAMPVLASALEAAGRDENVRVVLVTSPRLLTSSNDRV